MLKCKYLKQKVSQFPDMRKEEMKENRRKGGKQERKDAALVLYPLCPRRNEHHHLRQEELTVLSSFSQRTEVLQPPLFHLGQR